MNPGEKFNCAINVVLEHEGGLSDNPNDRGGITNFGISKQFVIDNNLSDDPYFFVKRLTKNDAIAIYRRYIWDKYHYVLFADVQIATKVFDMTVNSGPHESHILLQRSINDMSHDQLLVDGICGVKTIASANALPPSFLHQKLREKQEQFYRELVENMPSYRIFLDDWLKRAAW